MEPLSLAVRTPPPAPSRKGRGRIHTFGWLILRGLGSRQQFRHHPARLGQSARGGVRTEGQPFGMHEGHIGHPDKAQDRPQIWLLEIQRPRRASGTVHIPPRAVVTNTFLSQATPRGRWR